MTGARKLDRRVFAVIGVLAMLMDGVGHAWSVMTNSIWLSHPEWALARLSFTYTMMMVFFAIGNLVIGALAKRLRANVIMILSAILFCGGFLISSLTQDSLWTLYVGYGAMCGLASGFVYNTVVSTLTSWFPDRQGLISGLMLMGYALSSSVTGLIYSAVTPADGSMRWCVSLRWLGIIVGVILLVSSFFMVSPGEDFVPPQSKRRAEVKEAAMDVGAGKMLRTVSFWMFYAWVVMTGFYGIALVGHASGIAMQAGPGRSAATIAIVVGLISILRAVGSVVYGEMYDRMGHRFTIFLVVAFFAVAAVLLILALASSSFLLVVIGFIVAGFGYGGITPTASALVSDFYGRSHFSFNFSIILTTGLITSFASTISGRLYDISHSYMSTLVMMLIVVAVGFAVALGVRRPKAKT